MSAREFWGFNVWTCSEFELWMIQFLDVGIVNMFGVTTS
jgi:hypothetical protein